MGGVWGRRGLSRQKNRKREGREGVFTGTGGQEAWDGWRRHIKSERESGQNYSSKREGRQRPGRKNLFPYTTRPHPGSYQEPQKGLADK